MSKHYSPLRYPGGKTCIFPFVSGLFYENSLIGTTYAEPYAGGSGLALKLLFEGYTNKIYINDFDFNVYAFWSSILAHTDEFCRWVSDVEISIENWQHFKDIQRVSLHKPPFEVAKATFFLNRTNVSGVLKGGVIGGQDQTGKYKINARFNKENLIEKIQAIGSMRERIVATNLDGIKFIQKLNKTPEDLLIYLDPPYVQKGADLYLNHFKKHDHERLSRYVRRIKKKWLVSYDNNDLILELYNQNSRISYKLSQCASNRVGDEVLIFSDEVLHDNSIEKLKSPSCIL